MRALTLRKSILVLTALIGLTALGIAYRYDWNWDYLASVALRKSLMFAVRARCELAGVISKPKLSCQVQEGLAEYHILGVGFTNNLEDHHAFGDYLNYGSKRWSARGGEEVLSFDTDHIPALKGSRPFKYNPVTVGNYALSMYDRSLAGDPESRIQFQRAADRMLLLEDAGGALRYPFAFKYYVSGRTFSPGWVSAMAEGIALSVFVRAYHLSEDRKYLIAGDRAFDFLSTPISQGGTSTSMADLDTKLAGLIFFDEYPSRPSGYTLNGFMYTLLGLYDWSCGQGARAAAARQQFNAGILTLEHILPYYDLGGFTTYDLGYLTNHKSPKLAGEYHAVHIVLLHALASITGNEELRRYELLWSSYVRE